VKPPFGATVMRDVFPVTAPGARVTEVPVIVYGIVIVNVALPTELLAYPASVAMAFTVAVEETEIGPL